MATNNYNAIQANKLAQSYMVIALIMPDNTRQYWAVNSQEMLDYLITTLEFDPIKLHTLPQLGEWSTDIFKAMLKLGHDGEPVWLTQKPQPCEPLHLKL